MISTSILLIFLSIFQRATSSVSSKYEYFKTPVKPCRIGDVVQNECIKCLCTSKTVFECLPLPCDKDKIVENKTDTSKQICLPNQLYAKNLITCICNKDGRWPHKSCHDTFLSLPPNNVVHHKCDPDTYVVIDCNICRCGPDGEFISHRCTKNNCADSQSRRTDLEPRMNKNNVYSNCETRTWYSLAPCQFCYCVNRNKLICNTGNDESQKIGLGTYDMQICGKDVLKEVLELMPKSHKAVTQLMAKVGSAQSNSVNKVLKENDNVENITSQYISKTVKKADPKMISSELSESTEEKTKTTPSDDYTIKRAIHIVHGESSDTEDGDANGIPLDVPNAAEVTKAEDNWEEEGVRKIFTEASQDLEYNGKTLKINLPSVFSKMFHMALRKSMVSLDGNTECIPGATTKNGCNKCFCLKNGKLLCTAHKC